MKLLGWMHRKLMQNPVEPMKDYTIGKTHACLSMKPMFDENNYHGELTKNMSHSNIKCQISSKKYETNNEELMFQPELLEPFDFLSIGTFGLELLNTDPPTPALATPFRQYTNEQAEITENDLKIINYELEKFLEAEEKEIPNDTSERSSHVSITTLFNKPIEAEDSEGHACLVACPLQNYLFAISIELAEKDKEVKKEKASLGELFQRNSMVGDDHDPTRKCERSAQQTKRRNLGHFMKKVVKKIHPSSSNCKASTKNDVAVSNSIKKKLFKALKMFHKKVYPEETTEKQSMKQQHDKKKNVSCLDGYQIEGDNETNKFVQAASEKNRENTIKLSPNDLCKCPSTDNGHWIKTDSDYLVLEL